MILSSPKAEEFLGYFCQKIKIGDALIVHHDSIFFEQHYLEKSYECTFNDMIFGLSNGQNYFLTEETYTIFALICYELINIDLPAFQVIKNIGKERGIFFDKENELDGIIIFHTFFDYHPFFINLKIRNHFINPN
jgi:hypothetical protein